MRKYFQTFYWNCTFCTCCKTVGIWLQEVEDKAVSFVQTNHVQRPLCLCFPRLRKAGTESGHLTSHDFSPRWDFALIPA